VNGEARERHNVRPAIIVAAATLLALALPAGAPLYAQVYPEPDSESVAEAITDASLDARFESPPVTQFETATFNATVIYGVSSPDPDLPTVKVAWSNEAVLTAKNEGSFEITQTSLSRQFLNAGTRRPGGGYELTWSWDVTPLVAGEQKLIISILPTVVVKGQVIPEFANINDTIEVTVDVHPVQHDFNEVLAAAESMETDVPGEMIVGEGYDVSASLPLLGHGDTVSADIELAESEESADVTILEVSAAPAAAHLVAASDTESVVRRWTVIADEPGQVALVFTATVQGQAATQNLKQDVPVQASARATERGPSPLEVVQQPVQYLTPFVALAIGLLGLWAAWKKRKAGEKASASESSSDDAAS
jgi:hypothetical protein